MKILFILLFCSSAFAQEASLIEPLPAQVLPNEVLSVKPVIKHHLNPKYPYDCGGGSALEMNPRKLDCQFKTPGEYTVRLGVCDDKETFCRITKAKVSVAGVVTEPMKMALPVTKQGKIKPIVHGFINNDTQKALVQVKKQKGLLLFDFYGEWCPPCRELEEYVFDSPEFKKAAKAFVKVRIDADTPLANEWRDRFKIQGLPTLLVANSSLEEIGRIVGSRRPQRVAAWLNAQTKLKNRPIANDLTNSSIDSRLRIAQWRDGRGETKEALAALGDSDLRGDAELLRDRLRVDIASDEENLPVKTAGLEQLIKKYPQDARFAYWVIRLLEANVELGKPYVEAALKSLANWRKDPRLPDVDLDVDVADLYMAEGEIYGLLKNEDKKKAAYLKAVQELDAIAQRSNLRLSKGTSLRKAYALSEAGLRKDASELFVKLVTAYSDEYIFNYRYAKLLHQMKDDTKALYFVTKAETLGYGDNWLRSIYLKADILASLGKKAEAKALIQKTLAEISLPQTTAAWTHYRVQDLRELLASLDKR